jgi:hypothetical protein
MQTLLTITVTGRFGGLITQYTHQGNYSLVGMAFFGVTFTGE